MKKGIYKITSIVIIFIVLTSLLTGCKKAKKEEKEKQLNIYMDVKDKDSQNILKIIIEEYKKENSSVKVSINNSIGSKIEDDLNKGSAVDLVVSNRAKTINLIKKGLIVDMKSIYEKNKIMERYYNVAYNYGRFNDKYYAMSVIPYTIELMYNADALNKHSLKKPIGKEDSIELLKGINKKGIKIPVLINEDLDVYTTISSFVVNNTLDVRKLENNFDGGKGNYKEIKEMQNSIDLLKSYIKPELLNKNLFELGNNSTIEGFMKGEIPIVIASSYYTTELRNSNVKAIDDYSIIFGTNSACPVYSNSLIAITTSSKNGDIAEDFIKFIFEDKTQKVLLDKGFVTGNKRVNAEITGLGSTVVKHLVNANENNIIYTDQLTEKINSVLKLQLKNVFEGQLSKNEWETIIDEVYR